MKIRIYLLLIATIFTSHASNAALVQVDITGSIDWYIEGNYFGVDNASSVSGYIIYDDVITQTDGDYTITNYSDWEFELNIGNNTTTEADARPRPNVGAGETESWITFENGNLTWMWFQTIEGFDPGISRSNIFAADDYYDYYPGYDFYFEMVHEYNEDVAPALWLMADGGMSLSVPTPVSAVPLPASLLLFFLVL